eukprot:3885979-Amphidinium_carterae.1
MPVNSQHQQHNAPDWGQEGAQRARHRQALNSSMTARWLRTISDICILGTQTIPQSNLCPISALVCGHSRLLQHFCNIWMQNHAFPRDEIPHDPAEHPHNPTKTQRL